MTTIMEAYKDCNFEFIPVFWDVGSRYGLQPQWEKLEKEGYVEIIGFEPNNDECKRLNSMTNVKHYPYALGERQEERFLYQTRNPGCSSLLLPNIKVIKNYKFQTHIWDVMEEIPTMVIDGKTLIENHGVPAPDYMKLDTQGFEYFVLKGLGKYLEKVWAFEIETHFHEIYEGEKLFFEIHEWLTKEKGFMLRQLDNVSWYDGEQVEFLAYFMKSPGTTKPGDAYLRTRFFDKVNNLRPPLLSCYSDTARVDSPNAVLSKEYMEYYDEHPY
tara:strand:+ start:6131 stop:6943 length:813 start_codon:yes stop_codon:yes gene_type:complete